MADVPTTNGSVGEAIRPALRDAVVVQRLRRQGMVVMGKTNLSELAFSGLGTNEHYGSPVNPVSTVEPLVPGGSSSGSAAAVSAGLVPVALGTDTSGSVRVPAAFCGVVGYKASEGLVPLHGVRGPFGHVGQHRDPGQVDRGAASDRLAPGVRTVYADEPGRGPLRLVVPEGDEVVESGQPERPRLVRSSRPRPRSHGRGGRRATIDLGTAGRAGPDGRTRHDRGGRRVRALRPPPRRPASGRRGPSHHPSTTWRSRSGRRGASCEPEWLRCDPVGGVDARRSTAHLPDRASRTSDRSARLPSPRPRSTDSTRARSAPPCC